MPRFFYDLHLHSCLSPCADDDMTPWNLVHMSALCGQQIIALTDHNAAANCSAALAAASSAGIVVVPGMELCTAEEIHMICLFSDLEAALAFDEIVNSSRLSIFNKPEIFGNQLVVNDSDEIVSQIPHLLVAATQISVDALWELCQQHRGICFPAHIDRQSYSLSAVLGSFEKHHPFTCAEISLAGNVREQIALHPALKSRGILQSSDAHRLADIPDSTHTIELEECSAPCLIETLMKPDIAARLGICDKNM
ncbi:PHP domain-containing protein [Oscillospiraceae bacterium MB08-C2-2]|nr:PHP domain-containing protein [Oscillospiraceae bacterium MB08-C2-2]